MTEYTLFMYGDVAEAGRAAADAAAAPFGPFTFGAAASATGTEPATHRFFATVARPATAAAIAAGTPAEVTIITAPRTEYANVAAFQAAVLADRGLARIVPDDV